MSFYSRSFIRASALRIFCEGPFTWQVTGTSNPLLQLFSHGPIPSQQWNHLLTNHKNMPVRTVLEHGQQNRRHFSQFLLRLCHEDFRVLVHIAGLPRGKDLTRSCKCDDQLTIGSKLFLTKWTFSAIITIIINGSITIFRRKLFRGLEDNVLYSLNEMRLRCHITSALGH